MSEPHSTLLPSKLYSAILLSCQPAQFESCRSFLEVSLPAELESIVLLTEV